MSIKIFGDSHCRIFKKCINKLKIDCSVISGGTITGLPKRISTLEIQNKIFDYLENNKPKYLILKFGQVDIDLRYYYKSIKNNSKIDKVIYIKEVIQAYKIFLTKLIEKYPDINIIIWGINPPTLVTKESCFKYTKRIIFNESNNEDENILYEIIESIEDRTLFSKHFNNNLSMLCKEYNLTYVDVFDDFLDKNNIISNTFTNNNDHHIKGIENEETNFEKTTLIFQNKLKEITI